MPQLCEDDESLFLNSFANCTFALLIDFSYSFKMEKFQHKKSLGQHFLNSDYAPKKMCDAADIEKRDIVLEIGPGTGILTKELLRRGAKVIALEADLRAISALNETFADEIDNERLIIHHYDVRELNVADFNLKNQAFKVVSNIPYYLSGLLFRSLLDAENQPNTLVFLIQKEVAKRIVDDKKESLLSISIKVFGDPTYICTIKKGHFTPAPKIDSAIISIKNISKDNLQDSSSELFFNILRLGFGQKRKQLLGNLAQDFPRQKIKQTFLELNIPSNIRAENLALYNWIQIVNKLSQ